MTKVDFILVNFNMSGLTYHAVEQIRMQFRDKSEYKVILADNSTDPEFSIDCRYEDAQDIQTVRLGCNSGFVGAIRSILHLAQSEYVVFLHPDIEFVDNCISDVVQFLDANPKVGIASPNIIYPNGRPCKIRLKLPTLGSECRRVFNLIVRGIFRRDLIQDEVLWNRMGNSDSEMTMSVCMFVRKLVIEKIGPLPECLWTYYLNDLIGYRAGRLGYSCTYVLGPTVIHYERYADPKWFSRRSDSGYKTSPIPVESRMLRDKFTFLRESSSSPKLAAYKGIILMEYTYLTLASLLKIGKRRREFTAYVRVLRKFCFYNFHDFIQKMALPINMES